MIQNSYYGMSNGMQMYGGGYHMQSDDNDGY